ncbi:MAG TPA: ABC transporter ATP-binding protein [Flavobacteriales bacterium]|nr:ABC transporter ATP-binding protein [Flavobacteriales bacterium]
MSALLTTRGLNVGFGRTPLLEGVDLTLDRGAVVALIGVNGGGKSTLLRTLSGGQAPLSGTVEIDGLPLTAISASARARHMALVLTERPQAGLLDVRTLVAFGRQPWTGHFGRLTTKDNVAIDRAMELADVTAFASRSVQQLSDGEAQRVMIARAIAQDAPLLLLDEPTAFLDLVNRVRVFRLLRDLAHREGKGVLLSTHDLQTALDLCDRVLLINGKAVWSGTTDEARASGILERTFAAAGLRFDPASGSFRSV